MSSARRIRLPDAPSLFLVGLIAGASYLVLFNLDQTPFWDDESQVGIVGTNLLEQGRLTGWDGRNLIAYRNGRLLDDELVPRNPPLSYVVAAGSFRVLGRSTWAGRLPFAIMGIGTLVLLAWLVGRIGGSRSFALFSVAMTGLSPLFVLNARQCLYNAPCMFFAVLIMVSYEAYFAGDERRPGWLVLLTAACVLLFFAHFLIAVAFLVGLVVVFATHQASSATTRDWGRLTAAALAFLAITVPYAFDAQIWNRPDLGIADRPSIGWSRMRLLVWNLRDLNFSGMLPWTLGVASCVLLIRRRGSHHASDELVRKCLVLGLVYTAVVALLSPQPADAPARADLRYLVAGIPILAVPIAFVPWRLSQRSMLSAVLLTVVAVSSNALSMPERFQWRLPSYLCEIHTPYPTAVGEVRSFLEDHVPRDSVVYCFPEFNVYPLIFYVGDRHYFGALLDAESPLADAAESMDAPLRSDQHFPDWVVVYGAIPGWRERVGYFCRPHTSPTGTTRQYRYVLKQMLPVDFRQTQRPELNLHRFGPPPPTPENSVYVLERQLHVRRPDESAGDLQP